MVQTVYIKNNETHDCLEFPDANDVIMPGVLWGRVDQLFTPAYWKLQAILVGSQKRISSYRMGRTLQEEVGFCVLGGYGIPAELGILAFQRLRDNGLFEYASSEATIFQSLSEPFTINGRRTRYRFPQQKSLIISTFLHIVYNEGIPEIQGTLFRDWLTNFPGIGLKTASWITRNWFSNDDVAIIDIHIYRAGVIAKLFQPTKSISKQYLSMEDRFVSFSKNIDVKTSFLDTIIWEQMKQSNRLAINTFESIVSSPNSKF